MTDQGADGPATRGLLGPRIIAGVLVVGALFLIVQALEVERGGGYSVVSPGTIPLATSIGLLILGAALAVRTTVAPDRELAESAAEEELACHWPTIGYIGALLVLYAVALNGVRIGSVQMPGLGYIVATIVFLPIAARVLGSLHLVRDVVVALVLALAVYFGFTEALGVRLPPGVLDAVLP